MRRSEYKRTGIDRRNKTPRGNSSHSGRHYYLRENFWRENPFWEDDVHTQAAKDYFRSIYSN